MSSRKKWRIQKMNKVILMGRLTRESKASSQNNAGGNYQQPASNNSSSGDGFMNVPDGIDEELPFV